MRIMQPRTGFALVGAALLATGVTSMAFGAQNQADQPVCYSTCPPKIDLKETFRILHPGAENIEDFSVRVGPDVIGTTNADAPTGTVTIKAGSTVLCTITLFRGKGSCRPSADVAAHRWQL